MTTLPALREAAAAAGFDLDSYEKVVTLVRLLEAIRAHPFIGPRLALKGGTALNLFVLDFPRLSVGIDLNDVGAADRPTMLAERPQVERALGQVCGRLGITIKNTPGDEHAGGKWQGLRKVVFRRHARLKPAHPEQGRPRRRPRRRAGISAPPQAAPCFSSSNEPLNRRRCGGPAESGASRTPRSAGRPAPSKSM
jgi:hypothetical protein